VPAAKTYKIGLDGKRTEFIADSKKGDGQAFGPDGRLYEVAAGAQQIIAYDEAGQAKVVAEGFRGNDLVVRHDGSIYVTTPDYEIIDNSSNTWKGTSDSAWVNKDGTIMKLEGKVTMHRVPTEKVEQVDLLSSDVTITTDPKPKDAQGRNVGSGHRDKRMETAAQTTIYDTARVSHGVGMKADLDLKTTELLADVHIISLPGKNHAGK
jgi:LPS export ABC transporter protein LptC